MHEVAGSLALAVQRALWGFDGGAELEGGCYTDGVVPADCSLARLEACNGHLGKRLEPINERMGRRAG
jgi:hypothetical protein